MWVRRWVLATCLLTTMVALWLLACRGRFNGRTPIMELSWVGAAPLVRMLVGLGAAVNDVSVGPYNAQSPLAFAAVGGHLATVRILLDAGADPNWGGWRNRPPVDQIPERRRALCLAVSSKDASPELVRLLIERGAKGENLQNGFSALDCLGSDPGRAEKAALLLEAGVSPDAYSLRTREPFIVVYARAGWPDIVGLLLDYGASVNVAGPDGETALSMALASGHDTVARIVSDYGGAMPAPPASHRPGDPVLGLSSPIGQDVPDRRSPAVLDTP